MREGGEGKGEVEVLWLFVAIPHTVKNDRCLIDKQSKVRKQEEEEENHSETMADIVFQSKVIAIPSITTKRGGYDAPRRQIKAQGRQKD